MMKRRIVIVCLLALLFGGFMSIYYVNPYGGEIALSELLFQLSGSRGEFALRFSANELLSFAMLMVPGWVLEAFLGIELYRHFCTASIYVFSRCEDRRRWYWKEMLLLGAEIFLFQILTIAAALTISCFRFDVKISQAGMILLVYHILVQFFWTYSAAIAVNLLALKAGSSVGFAIVIFAQTFCVGLLGFGQVIERFYEENITAMNLLVKLNPISHLVLGWHSSYMQSVDAMLKQSTGIPCESFYAEISLLCLLIVNAIILKIGSIVIGKHDLLISDAEMGVA